MAQNIQVKCLVNRFWDPAIMDWDGDLFSGILIDFSTQSSEDFSGKIIPVGIVLLENDTFQSVPMEYIYKI